MYLPMLSDDELLAHYASTVDDLTTTAMERELYARFSARLEQEDDPAQMALVDAGWHESPVELAAMFKTLDEYSIGPEDLNLLREKLERSNKFYEIAADAGDIFQRLQALAAKSQ